MSTLLFHLKVLTSYLCGFAYMAWFQSIKCYLKYNKTIFSTNVMEMSGC